METLLQKTSVNLQVGPLSNGKINRKQVPAVDHLIPGAEWSDPLPEANFATLCQFERSLALWKETFHQFQLEHNYNSFAMINDLYQTFRQSGQDFVSCFEQYQVPTADTSAMACIGDSIKLMEKLVQTDPQFGFHFRLVSCQEWVSDGEPNTSGASLDYDLDQARNLKHHALPCLKFVLSSSDRQGYVLLETGHHMFTPVVVMRDAIYPHTGWFMPPANRKVHKEHCYQLKEPFIEWNVRLLNKSTGALLHQYHSVLHVARQYCNATVGLKRSILCSIKSYCIRRPDRLAGVIMSAVNCKNLIIIHHQDGDPLPVVESFSIEQLEDEQVRDALKRVAQLELPGKRTEEEWVQIYLQMLQVYRESLDDDLFFGGLWNVDHVLQTEL